MGCSDQAIVVAFKWTHDIVKIASETDDESGPDRLAGIAAITELIAWVTNDSQYAALIESLSGLVTIDSHHTHALDLLHTPSPGFDARGSA